MTNKECLIAEIEKQNCVLGCYDELLDKITRAQLAKVIDELWQEYTDVKISINRKPYVVEIETIEGEKDFTVLTKEEYVSRYGEDTYKED